MKPTKSSISTLAVEAMARRWQQFEAIQFRLNLKRDLLKEKILRAVAEHGEIAPDAKSMRVLRGLAREMQVTYPVETSVDPAAVRQLLTQIPRSLGRRLFLRSQKFTLRPGADALAVEQLRTSARLTLFALAVRRTPGSPRVKVVKVKKSKAVKRQA